MAFDSQVIELERGQFVTSQVALANAWGWSRGKVQRFLALLQSDQMIEQQTSRRHTVLTICNYDHYQDHAGSKRAGQRTTGEPPTNSSRAIGEQPASTIKKGKNSKKGKHGKKNMAQVVPLPGHSLQEPTNVSRCTKRNRQPVFELSEPACTELLEQFSFMDQNLLNQFIVDANDYLKSIGETRKDYVAYMRIWIRRNEPAYFNNQAARKSPGGTRNSRLDEVAEFNRRELQATIDGGT